MDKLPTDIPNYESFVKVEPVNEGHSHDKKYYVKTSDGARFLLRLSDISEYEHKKSIFNMMKSAASSGVPMSAPIDFGVCNNNKNVYQLLTWCDGKILSQTLYSKPEIEQYLLGRKAGDILSKIHAVPAPDDFPDWHTSYTEMKDYSITALDNCGIKIEKRDIILHYFDNNVHLIKNRPPYLCHNDYHLGNIIADNQNLSVLDWELAGYADPWSDFTCINGNEVNPHFISGFIHGYFEGEPPEDFWPLFALYVSFNALAIIPWAVNAHSETYDPLAYALQNLENAAAYFNNMSNPIPTWYLKQSHFHSMP